MKLKSIVNRVPPVSLGMKVTLYFVGFGLFIGYLSFILFTIGSARANVELAYQIIVPLLNEITGTKGDDFISDLINTKNKEIVRLNNVIHRTSSAYGRILSTIFFLRKGGREWKKIYVDRDGIFRERPAGLEEIPLLETALKRRFHHSSRFFFGRSDRVSLYMLLPLNRAQNVYILSLEMDREGITLFIRKNVHRIAAFGTLLLLVSFILGKVFAYRIAGPIKKLSAAAQGRAAGDLKQEFTLERRDEIGALSDSLKSMTHEIDRHLREVERRVKTMETMNQIDKAVLSSISRSDLMGRIILLVSSLFGSDFTALLLYDPNRHGFGLLSSSQIRGEGMLSERPFISQDTIGSKGMARLRKISYFTPGKSEDDIGDIIGLRGVSGIKIGVNVPVNSADTYRGSLLLVRIGTSAFFSEKEVESAKMLADQVGIALQSVRAFEEKEQLLLGILLALTRSIDAKSKWTAGHSERVAMYSEKIGVRLGMNDNEVRTLALSALLHDIGKIAISELILDKPGRLTEQEYALIKEHPATGARIIADIPSYGEILPGILYHHEHWDGSGYPRGLRGEEIPFTSRIITIADVYDAITADRPYRKGLSDGNVIAFMMDQSGALFDASIVTLLLEILREEGNPICTH
ncbi:MAG: HD domain-containing protein [Chrysiogenales bacterium]|nr:MAG: HD domain-containing protein [Chrysiogenales bacterium]